MLQIFSTQLTGKMKMIKEKHEEMLEDCSRILAQSVLSEHTIYIYGSGTMKSILPQAMHGEDELPRMKVIEQIRDVSSLQAQDCVLLFAPTSDDENALEIAKIVSAQQTPLIAIIGSVPKNQTDQGIIDLADFSLNLQVSAMVPQDDGTRIGTPTALLALYVYHCLHLTTTDILAEYD